MSAPGTPEQLKIMRGIGWVLIRCPVFECLRIDARSSNPRTLDRLINVVDDFHAANCIGTEQQ